MQDLTQKDGWRPGVTDIGHVYIPSRNPRGSGCVSTVEASYMHKRVRTLIGTEKPSIVLQFL